MRALASRQCDPGSIVAGVLWVEFAVGSHLAPRVFLRLRQFTSLHKNQHLQILFDQDRGLT